MNQETKNNRIIGLVIGLIFFLILFYFDFDDFDFDKRNSFFGLTSKALAKSMVSGSFAKVSAAAKKIWFIFSAIYLALVWIYRGCIGHWFKRIISSLYKKI